jgi:phosphoenolpyruvate carboxylase
MISVDEKYIDQLAGLGYEKYLSFKNHPKFIPYLEQMSTLNIMLKQILEVDLKRVNHNFRFC